MSSARAADKIGDQSRISFDQSAPARDGRVERQKSLGFIRQEPARIVIKDGRRPPRALAQFEELVDLLLVFRDRDARRAVARISRQFVGWNVGKDGGRKGAQRHGR